jgi:hypothetical protein
LYIVKIIPTFYMPTKWQSSWIVYSDRFFGYATGAPVFSWNFGLTALKQIPGYDNEVLDGWGRLIEYRKDVKGLVTLVSLGRDGIPGGTGEDTDLVHPFRSKGENGQWADELVEWENEEP